MFTHIIVQKGTAEDEGQKTQFKIQLSNGKDPIGLSKVTIEFLVSSNHLRLNG